MKTKAFALFAFISVMHRDVRMPQAQRPPWMAEGRTTQEQLSRCARAAHLRTSAFDQAVAGMAVTRQCMLAVAEK